MRSPAYLDFLIRLREAILLIRLGREDADPSVAGACSKSAAVLLAAALERYINAVLAHVCSQISKEEWNELPSGMQRYLCVQISRKLSSIVSGVEAIPDVTGKKSARIKNVVSEAEEAFRNPSTWRHFQEFGLFLDGAAAPARLNAMLRDFRADGITLFELLEQAGQDRSSLGRSLGDLIDTRHAVAHAIPNREVPSPNDVAAWAVVAFAVARGVEAYLEPALSNA